MALYASFSAFLIQTNHSSTPMCIRIHICNGLRSFGGVHADVTHVRHSAVAAIML
jgi:hypothetical protein